MYSFTSKGESTQKIYPERDEPDLGKDANLTALLGGCMAAWLQPSWRRYRWIVKGAAAHGPGVARWSDKRIQDAFRKRGRDLRRNGFQRNTVAQIFALIREVADRSVGMRHLDVQLVGGAVMLKGMVAEMETGEGKTLTATLPACTLASAGVAVHIITVNDYLAGRDAAWMAPIYEALGLTVGTIVHGMDPGARRAAYRCHVTYCTNKEVAFDYLRDRLVLWDRPGALRMQIERLFGPQSRTNQLLLRGLQYAIVDEADSVLIDEARTPLIISAEADEQYDPDIYRHALDIAGQLAAEKDFQILADEHKLELAGPGKRHVDAFEWPETGIRINSEQRREMVRQALVALYLFDRDKHYLVQDGKVQIVDEYTGRLMADRSWEKGLHQLIELKEGCEVTRHKETRARISYQRFFRRYLGLAGMTGTAREVAGELWTIYRLRVVRMPTNRPLQRRRLPGLIYTTADKKWQAVLQTVAAWHRQGRPVLVGTRSVEASEHLSRLMDAIDLPHQVLNARQDQGEADIIVRAGELGRITVATNMAGRGTDIRLAEGAIELGGLHVIATERHEAGRIDRQLFGRCGRQGDPGCYQAIVSLEDELISVYAGRVSRGVAAAVLKIPVHFVSRWIGRSLFRKAQRKAERRHARMRRDLLKFDDTISTSLAFTGRTE